MTVMHKALLIFLISLVIGCSKNPKISTSTSETYEKTERKDSLKKKFVGQKNAKATLNAFITDTTENLYRDQILIKTKEELICIAEPILFRIYGKDIVLSEKPYEIYLFGDNWIMMGTLPEGWKGGTFAIAINRKTCKVIGIRHEK